jgi:hypothetical protein
MGLTLSLFFSLLPIHELLFLLLLFVIGIILIVLVVKILLIIVPAAIIAIVVWFITGSLLWGGVAFLVVAVISLLKH